MTDGNIYEVTYEIRIAPYWGKQAWEVIEELLHPTNIEELDDSGEYRITYRVPIWLDLGDWSPEEAALRKVRRLLEAELNVQDARVQRYLEVQCEEVE